MNSETSIQKLFEVYELNFPTSYLEFIKNPHFEKFFCPKISSEFWIFQIQDLIEVNSQTQINEFLPNFLIIGSDKGNELLTFKLDEPNKWAVFATPQIVMSEDDSIHLADNFESFLQIYSTTK